MIAAIAILNSFFDVAFKTNSKIHLALLDKLMGRKPLDIPKVRVNVRLDGNVFPYLEQIAREDGRTVASFLAQLGADAVNQQISNNSLAKKLDAS